MVSGPDSRGLYTFKNGAKAIKRPDGRYLIVQGASKQYMQSIRQQRGGLGQGADVPASECECYKPWNNGCANGCPVCPTSDEWDKDETKCPWMCDCEAQCSTQQNPTFENCSDDCPYYRCKSGQ